MSGQAREQIDFRSSLENLAYRMLGTWADAEDVAQESLIRWHAQTEAARELVREPLAWLRKVATRICLDRLKSAKRKRETYVGPWLPEPILVDERTPGSDIEREESINMALMVAFERLSPSERAAFILHDIFGYTFESVADILGKSSSACRQLASRARASIRSDQARFELDPVKHRKLLDAFTQAALQGDQVALEQVLSDEVVLHSDGGGVAPAARRILKTREIVVRLFLGLSKRAREDGAVYRFISHEMNGQPGIVVIRNERVDTALSISVSNNQIQAIYQQRNPSKLARIASRLNLSCSEY